MKAIIPEDDFIRLFQELGPAGIAKRIGQTIRSVYARREAIEKRLGIQLTTKHPLATRHNISHPQRATLEVKNGIVLVGSDAHYWPGEPSTAHRAFVKFCKDMKPAAVIMNGDVLDCATVSRHAPIGWEKRPALIEEIETAKERLYEIEKASGRARKIWPLGNHDARFETRLATVAPEYAKVHGVHLHTHYPLWEPCWSAWINDDVVVKHRFKGGIHAPHNNTMWAGKTMITGHLHSAKVIPFTDYKDTRYGVDTGCLADIYSDAFTDYLEDSPRNWRSGFCVLTFKDGKLLQPELVLVWDRGHVQFRGEIISA